MRRYRAVIGLGSNLGDRAANLLRAVQKLLEQGINVVRCSDIYETDPVDYLDQPSFLNMVALVGGNELPSPLELLSICLKIEADLGRDRLIPKGPRLIDLDLLIYDHLIFEHRADRTDLSISDRLDLRSDQNDLRSDQFDLIDQTSTDRTDLRSTDQPDQNFTDRSGAQRSTDRSDLRSTDQIDLRLADRPRSERSVDLDHLDRFNANKIDLVLPHPRLHERGFVLVPLVELIPEDLHPGLQMRYCEILARLPIQDGVRRYHR